jgi:hypothetical protein
MDINNRSQSGFFKRHVAAAQLALSHLFNTKPDYPVLL